MKAESKQLLPPASMIRALIGTVRAPKIGAAANRAPNLINGQKKSPTQAVMSSTFISIFIYEQSARLVNLLSLEFVRTNSG